MEQSVIISETEVFLATLVFLLNRKVKPFQFSLARGQGNDNAAFQKQFTDVLKQAGIQPKFYSEGPDISGISATEFWQIECKGSGSGKSQTQRNNFDRALSSVVSYYDDCASKLPEQLKNVQQYLGLALPATRDYLRELTRRVRKPLRQKLNLWILLYDFESKSIRAVSPNDEY